MANRKLLGEIERVLKKVDEGVIVFEQIWDKVYSASTTAQKEKYEADLKKEIKKLQRLRDQIKTWQGDSSVKDKTKLDANRRLIEEKMEKFKVCEKETKTKAFSKEGLAQERIDPKQKAKGEVGDWVREAIARLEEQSDEFEAEIEQLNSSGKRKKRGEEPPRVGELKEHVLRHAHHVQQLERVLRAIDNDQVSPEQCTEELRDNVDYYLESNQDPEFVEDDEMYDFLDSAAPTVAVSAPSLLKDKKEKSSKNADSGSGADSSMTKPSPAPSAAGVALSAAANAAAAAAAAAAAGSSANGSVISPKGGRNSRVGQDNGVTSPTRGGPGAKVGSIVSPSRRGGRESTVSPTRPQQHRTAQELRAAQAQAEQQRSVGVANKAPLMSSVLKGQQMQQPLAHQQYPQGMTPAQMQLVRQQQQQQQKRMQEQHQQALVQQQQQQRTRQPPQLQQQRQMMHQGDSQQFHHLQQQQLQQHGTAPAGSSGAFGVVNDVAGGAQNGPDLTSAAGKAGAPGVPGVKLEHMASSSSTQSGPNGPLTGIESELASLDSALGMMPEGPRSADIASPPSFPQVPASVLDNRAIFEKFDPDTLFFIFYYQQGTYQQYLASRELKRQGWRFHTKYLTWFQRHEEPKISTDEYETGTFVYFDYANVVYRGQGSGWCQRIKSDFSFEYRYLE